ncbi:MAG: DUF5777 family beta-barrel protein [Gemmatimonadota bacterium]
MSHLQIWTLALTALAAAAPSAAQPSWHRAESGKAAPVELFHATMLANFPTTESLKAGDFRFEISHRFVPPIADGLDVNYGLDGPVNMRISLSYGVRDRTMVTLGRSNLMDNWDLQVKCRAWQMDHPTAPSAVAVQVGVAVNTETPASLGRGRLDGDNIQYYGQVIGNTVLGERLGLGLAPSYVYNSMIYAVARQYTLTLGMYGQYWLNDMFSLWLEYNPALRGYQGVIAPGESGRSYDSVALGTAIETGGHLFYLFATNNTRLNPAQYLVGGDRKVRPGNLRLGFGITRYL